jgi:hypothetical protein
MVWRPRNGGENRSYLSCRPALLASPAHILHAASHFPLRKIHIREQHVIRCPFYYSPVSRPPACPGSAGTGSRSPETVEACLSCFFFTLSLTHSTLNSPSPD